MQNKRPVVRQMRLPLSNQFHQQLIRPLSADVSSQNVLARIEEETQGFTVISASSLASLAPEILKPSVQSQTVASIDNGWQEKRFRFYMEVEIDRTQYATRYAMVTGFTSHADLSHNQSIDPNMRLYLNSIVVYTDSTQVNNYTGMSNIARSVSTNTQVIQPINNTGMTEYSNRLRAHDVISNMAAQHILQDAGMTVNTIGAQYNVAQASRDRQLPSVYLSSVLRGGITAAKMSDSSIHANTLDHGYDAYYQEFIGAVKDPGFHGNPFTAMLMSRTNYGLSGFVTWAELLGLFPELGSEQITRVELPRGGVMDYTQHSEHLRGMGIENQALAIIQNMLPAIMSMFMIRHASFVITNETVTSRPEMKINGLDPMTDKVDARGLINGFQQQVMSQLVPAISNGNMMQFTILVSCNVLSEMETTIRFNGGYPIKFAVPLFSDSTTTAFGYGTRHELDSITHELSKLTHEIESIIDPSGRQLQSIMNAPAGQIDDPLSANVQQLNDFFMDPLQDTSLAGESPLSIETYGLPGISDPLV